MFQYRTEPSSLGRCIVPDFFILLEAVKQISSLWCMEKNICTTRLHTFRISDKRYPVPPVCSIMFWEPFELEAKFIFCRIRDRCATCSQQLPFVLNNRGPSRKTSHLLITVNFRGEILLLIDPSHSPHMEMKNRKTAIALFASLTYS